jgi:iron transport multicopper oxidase
MVLAALPLAMVVTTPRVASAADLDMNNNDLLRTGWYPDQSGLSPQVVQGGTFGQLFNSTVNGEVIAQPLVADNTLLVATESNNVYGLDPRSGASLWSDSLGAPLVQATDGHISSCTDIVPTIGVTSTPVVDPATNIMYLISQTVVNGVPQFYMHALSVTTGAEEPGFPVLIGGVADNDPTHVFTAGDQVQRPGLLLMNGVIYAGFGAHCWIGPEEGWIFGVGAVGNSNAGQITARWSDEAGVPQTDPEGPGGGIWMSGSGLVSDGPGQIVFATGTGETASQPTADSPVPNTLAQSIVRLAVQPNGSLQPADFFTPYDGAALNSDDSDIGSGGVVGLPPQYFGTAAHPNLFVQVGKQGQLYLLDAQHLGGYQQGLAGSDNVVYEAQNYGVWGKPSVWPGDGGWIYLTTAAGSHGAGQLEALKYGLDANGNPTLSEQGVSSDQFGYGSSAASITSSGTTSGTALVWVMWIPANSASNGASAQLRAYLPVPVNGTMQMVWSAPIGYGTKFAPPAVSNGVVYVATRDGHVLGFGSPVPSPLTASGVTFPTTVIGQTSTATETFTAGSQVTVNSVTASGPFTAGSPTPPVGTVLTAGQTFSVPVTFRPTQPGSAGGALSLGTSQGSENYSLSATAESASPLLVTSPTSISFGGVEDGQSATATVILSNEGAQPLTINSVSPLNAPYTVVGLPAAGSTIASGQSITATITFAPTQVGQYDTALDIDSTGGGSTTFIDGEGGTPPQMQVSQENIEFGTVPVGTTATASFIVQNVGGTALTIDKSKPPVGSASYTPVTSLGEGTTIQPGQSVTETVDFTPTTTGDQTAAWLIQGDDGSGLQTINFDGTGSAAPTPALTIGDTDVSLPTTGSTVANFPVYLTAATSTPVTVNYTTKDGSATAAAGNYTPTSGTLTIPAGQTFGTIPVNVAGYTASATQTFYVNLSKPAGATLAAGQGKAYLANLVLPASVGVSNTTVAAPASGQTASMVFTVTATALNPGQTFTVQAATADGTATAASGAYTPVSTTLTFSQANPVQTVTVPVLQAPAAGTNTNFVLNLSNVSSSANIADKQAIGTILGGGTPPLPAIYVDNTAVARPSSGTTTATFNLTLYPPSTQVVQVLAQTAANSTLVSGTDFAPVPADSVTFQPGQTTATVPVTINGSATSSGTGTVSLGISKADNAIIGNPGAKAYVVSPIRHQFVSTQPTTAWVSPSQPITVDVPLTLESPAGTATTVTASTANGTALAGTNYTATSATVTIAAGQTGAVFPVTVAPEPPGSPSTTFTVSLTNPGSGNTVIVDSTATVTLQPASANATVAPALVAPALVNQSPPASAPGNTPYSYTFTATGYPAPSFSVVEGGQLPPGITLDPTGILAGSPDQNGTFTFEVAASNGVGTPAVSAPITMTVTGASSPPQFLTDTPPTSATVGTPYSYTFAASGSPAPAFTVSSGSLPPGLTLQTLTGVLSGTPTTPGTYSFQVKAANTSGGNPAITPTITIGVGNASTAPTITTTTTATSVQVGQALAFTVTASGQPVPALSAAGTLPSGISFTDNGDGSGTFGGTPANGTEGTYSVTLTASNGVSPSATQTFTITVTGIPPAFVNQSAPATATVGQAYSYAYTATGDPAPAFTLASGSLPPGLTLASSGTLSGTPTTAGTYSFTVQAANGSGTPAVSATQNVTVAASAASADLQMILTGPASVAVNGTATYGVAVKNLGPSTATNVKAVLTIPSDMAVTTVPAGVTYANGQFTLTAATLASGANVKFQVTLTALSLGTASFSATGSSAVSDPNTANNTGTLSTIIKS